MDTQKNTYVGHRIIFLCPVRQGTGALFQPMPAVALKCQMRERSGSHDYPQIFLQCVIVVLHCRRGDSLEDPFFISVF